MLLGAGAEALAYDAAARALALDPTDPATLDALVRAATRLRRQSAALALLEAARAQAPDSLEPLLAVARMRAATGDRQGAVDAAAKATQQFPDAFEGWELLATLAAERRDEQELARVIEAIKAQFPDRWEVRYFTRDAPPDSRRAHRSRAPRRRSVEGARVRSADAGAGRHRLRPPRHPGPRARRVRGVHPGRSRPIPAATCSSRGWNWTA